tara:strand:+ start:35358 stop:37421 length:2064 start_codon:yes stop_codon:yes gene_type:complete
MFLNNKNTITPVFFALIAFYIYSIPAHSQLVAPELEYYKYDNLSEIPILLFAQEPEFNDVSLSPDGEHILYIYPKGKNFVFRVDPVDDEDDQEDHYIGSISKSLLGKITWVNDRRLLLEVNSFGGMNWGYENRKLTITITMLKTFFAFDVDRKGLEKLYEFKYDFNPSMLRRPQNFQSFIVDTLDRDENNILVSLTDEETGLPSVHYLDVYTGETKLNQKSVANISQWFADHDGNIRFGVGVNDSKVVMIARKAGEQEWMNLHDQELFQDDRFRPLSFGENENNFFVISPAANGRYAIYDFNIADGVLERKIFEHPSVDVKEVEFSKANKKLLSVTYQEDMLGRHYVDEDYQRNMEAINEALPNRNNYLISLTRDQNYMLIKSESDVFPGAYYRMDVENRQLRLVGELNTLLNPEYLSRQINKTYFARDGLEITSYLTLPQAVSAQGKPPLIVLPHAIPDGRDFNAYNYVTQFLASRGYAVFQPNYRGSSGYGFQFQTLGYGEWGRNIQYDIEDGVKNLISEGVIDENRICIMGKNFSGYIALMGAIQNKELFSCVIANAPLTDLDELVSSVKKSVGKVIAERLVGKRKKKEIQKVSPIHSLRKFRTPVLLFHGNVNQSIPFQNSEEFVKKMVKEKVPHRFVTLEGAGNDISTYENRKLYLEEIEAFLNEHIPVIETVFEPEEKASL